MWLAARHSGRRLWSATNDVSGGGGVRHLPHHLPALLINTQSVSWNNLAKAAQKGTATVVVTLAIDCYDDTHIDQPQRTLIEDRLTLMERIHWALQNFKPSGATPLVRTQTRLYHLPHLWKAYETTYLCEVTDTQPPNQSTQNTP